MFQATNQMGMGQDLDLFLEKRGCTLFLKQKKQTSQHLPSFFQSWYPWDPRGEPLGQFQAANGPLGGTSLDLVQVSHGLNQQRFNQLTYGIQPFNMENQGNHGKLWFIKFNQIKYIDSLYDLCSQN